MSPLIATARFLIALSALSLKASLAQRGAFALKAGFMAINNFVFFVFWWVLFEQVPSIRGYTLADMAVLFGVSAAGFGLAQTFAGGVPHLGRLIENGDLDTLLPQPKPTLLYAVGLRSQASGAATSPRGSR